jgi:hypothetical protein
MLDTALSFLNPYRWLAYIAGVAVVVGLLWYGVHSYNVSITKEAVATALAQERAAVKPAFDELESTIKERDLKIATIKAESDAERTKRQAIINTKTIELKNALQAYKILADKNTKLLGDANEFDRLLKSIEARNNDSADAASGSARFKQLSAAHQQCERSLREADTDLTETLGRLGEADAIIKALKN